MRRSSLLAHVLLRCRPRGCGGSWRACGRCRRRRAALFKRRCGCRSHGDRRAAHYGGRAGASSVVVARARRWRRDLGSRHPPPTRAPSRRLSATRGLRPPPLRASAAGSCLRPWSSALVALGRSLPRCAGPPPSSALRGRGAASRRSSRIRSPLRNTARRRCGAVRRGERSVFGLGARRATRKERKRERFKSFFTPRQHAKTCHARTAEGRRAAAVRRRRRRTLSQQGARAQTKLRRAHARQCEAGGGRRQSRNLGPRCATWRAPAASAVAHLAGRQSPRPLQRRRR
eukprot:289482-Chlamydomonas_euryale.AAC.4